MKMFYLKLFRVFGFIPQPFNPQANIAHYPLLIWSLLQIIVNLMKLYVAFVYLEEVVYTSDELGKIHDISKLIVLNLTHQTLLVDSILKRQKFRDFFTKLLRLQQIYQSRTKEHREENKRRSWNYSLKFSAFVLYTIFAEIKIILSLWHIPQFVYFWLLTNLGYFPVFMFNLYNIFLLDIVHLEQSRLNTELKSLVKFVTEISPYKCSRKFDDVIRARIRKAQKRHQLIFGLVQDLNEVLGLFWAIDALCTLIMCQYVVYWTYFQLYKSKPFSPLGSVLKLTKHKKKIGTRKFSSQLYSLNITM